MVEQTVRVTIDGTEFFSSDEKRYCSYLTKVI